VRAGALAAGWLALFLHSFFTIGLRFWSVPVLFWTALGTLIASLRLLRESKRGEASAPARRPLLGRSFGACVGYMTLLAAAVGTAEYLLVARGWRAAVAAIVMERQADDMDETTDPARLRTATGSVFYVDRVRAHQALGRFHLSRGSYGAAMEEFDRVEGMAADYDDVELMIAKTYLGQNRLREAIPHLLRYGALRPADVRSAEALYVALKDLSPGKQTEEMRRIHGSFPDSSKFYLVAGMLWLHQDPPDEERTTLSFAEALRKNPADAHAACLLGFQNIKARQYRKALELMRSAYDNGLRTVELYVNLAQLEAMHDDADRARKLLDEAKERFPKSDMIRETLDALNSGG
jgi:tetratricopeptide (TPR) repeat protein